MNGKTSQFRVSGAPDICAIVARKAQETATLQVSLSPGLSAYSFTFG